MEDRHSGIWKSLRDGDFEEEEIWDVLKNRPDYGSGFGNPKGKEMKESSSSSSSLPATRSIPKMIPRSSNNNSSASASSSHEAKFLQQSAPVNIPDWSKIHRNNNNRNKTSKNSASRFGDSDFFGHSVDDEDDGAFNYGGDNSDDDECDSKLPPHEFIAKRLARNQISSFSVLEGAGRTLKGRDLSKVRNAVLTKTGFLE